MKRKRFIIFALIIIYSWANMGFILPTDTAISFSKNSSLVLSELSVQIQNGDVRADEIVVRLQSNTALHDVQNCAGIISSSKALHPGSSNFIQVIQLNALEKLIEVLPKLQNCPGVIYAEPNYVVRSTDTLPNDPYFSTRQYGLVNIRAPKGWDYGTGSDSVSIAIIDSGVDLAHPDLANKIVAGYDFVNNDSNPQDDFGHGTHVAGIAAAVTNNNYGIAGVSWGAHIMPVKVLDSSGNGYTSNSALGIVWAADHGAKVINMSFGSSTSSSAMQDAINYAYSKGVTLVAASGNDGDIGILYPARYNHVIAVGATDSNNNRVYFSNFGTQLDLVAPGVNIFSTLISNTLGYKSGTSMATPFVSGLAAILSGISNSSSPDAIEQAMENSALDLGSPGRDDYYGYGLIQVDEAIKGILPPSSFSKITPTDNSINLSTELALSWEKSTFADAYEYCIDTSNDDGCDWTWVSITQNATPEINLQSNTTYYWQVRGLNSSGTTYADSNTWWSFTTETCFTLSASINPIEGGLIEFNPTPNCQNSTKYILDTQIEIIASPISSKYRFLNWSGDLIGNAPTELITMFADHNLTANFEKAIFDDVPFDYSQTLGGKSYNLNPYIQALWINGFTNGIWIEKDNSGNITYALYGPENYLNRGMVAKFLLNVVHGRDYAVPSLPSNPEFTLDNWSNPDISWAWPWAEELLSEGLTNGCYQDSETQERAFCPTNISSRAEGAKFGLTMKHGPNYLPPDATGKIFADMPLPILSTDPPAHWGIAWAEEAYLEGLLPSCGLDIATNLPLFCPDDPMNRAWVAYLIVKAKNLELP